MPPDEKVATTPEKVLAPAPAPEKVASKSVAPKADPFHFVNLSSGRFSIHGKGFGAGGTVKVNGLQAQTTEWGDTTIVGYVPDGVKAGTVTVEVGIDGETSQKGSFVL